MTRAPARRVSVVIVAREATPALLACIERVRRHTPSPAEVLIVDHGPAHGFAHRLATLADGDSRVPVIVLRAAEKVSYAAAVNQGIRVARGRWVVLLGVDTLVTPGWSAALLARARDTRVGLVGPVMNGAAGGPQAIGATPAYDGPAALDAFAARWASAHRGEHRRVAWLDGACLLIRRAVIERLGPLDETARDPVGELCARAAAAGCTAVLSREVFVHRDRARAPRPAAERARPRDALRFAPRVVVTPRGAPRITLCLIARNEAAVLARCLASAAPAVDEIVVVDTGSTDATREIARAHGAVVVERPWDDDFAAARNAALDAAHGDWILSLDADEELPARTAAQLRMTCTETSAPALRMPIENLGATGAVDSVHLAVRLFTRTPGHRWEGAIHEQVAVTTRVLDAPLSIRHHGYAEPVALRAKLERNRTLLERRAAASPDDPAIAFYLAQTRLALGDAGGAATVAEEGLRRVETQDRSLGLLLLDTLAAARFAAGEQVGAEEACRTALALRPDWIDPRLLLGRLCRRTGRLREALVHLGRYLSDRERLLADPTWPVRLPRLRALGAEAEARTELAHVHAMLGALGRARREAERAAALSPSSAEPIRLLAHIADATRDAEAQWGVRP